MARDVLLCFGCCGVFVWTMYWWREPRATLSNLLHFLASEQAAQGQQNIGGQRQRQQQFCCAAYDRDHPSNIRKRAVSIFCACAFGIAVVGFHSGHRFGSSSGGGASTLAAAFARGVRVSFFGPLQPHSAPLAALLRDTVDATFTSMRLTATLFLGVVAERLWHVVVELRAILAEEKQERGGGGYSVSFCSACAALRRYATRSVPRGDREWMVMLRNYVLCPVGEELYFRSLMFELLLMGGGEHRKGGELRWARATLVSVIVFSFAHFHHFVRYAEEALQGELRTGVASRVALRRALLASTPRSAGDALITAAFGGLSGIIFSRSGGNAIATTAAHTFCNFVGPPTPGFLNKREPLLKKTIVGAAHTLGIGLFIMQVTR